MPMDLSVVEAICAAALPAMRDSLWANDTRITMEYGPLEDDTVGQCTREAPYRKAVIKIDPAGHVDEADVLETLRHEVLHLVIGEFDVYTNIVSPFVPDEASDSEQRAWTLSCERTINRLESILDGLGWTAEALAGRQTTCAACERTWRAIAPEGTERVECPKCGEFATHGREG